MHLSRVFLDNLPHLGIPQPDRSSSGHKAPFGCMSDQEFNSIKFISPNSPVVMKKVVLVDGDADLYGARST